MNSASMRAAERRKAISELLHSQAAAISGGELSARFGVSRQIIVQDIALLKSAGYDIISTHYGYVLKSSPLASRVFKVLHKADQTEDELNTIIKNGGTVADVFVLHKVFGKVEAPLNIFTPQQVRQFMDGVKTGDSTELMNITGGVHYHTVRAETEEMLDEIGKALAAKGFLAEED